MMNALKILLLTGLLLLVGCEPLQTESNMTQPKWQAQTAYFYPVPDAQKTGKELQTVYVPVYSNVYKSDGGAFNLAVTLTLRNTDFTRPITITSLRYYNTGGELVEDYLKVPHQLAPMASTYFQVNQTDTRGGVGANFIVQWAGDTAVNTPIFEAVMVGISGTQGIGFLSTGKLIQGQR